ncbi:unnamed protein product [Miscanthus lutarioriparius]|uniref:Uncharacterized protein n=1 Tax=Miscanthus lutarioriparius TaxID=422564 RepID=A0A811MBN6_9POAL|nr:unnamed protein product [Miscanthus lutarioriparius]
MEYPPIRADPQLEQRIKLGSEFPDPANPARARSQFQQQRPGSRRPEPTGAKPGTRGAKMLSIPGIARGADLAVACGSADLAEIANFLGITPSVDTEAIQGRGSYEERVELLHLIVDLVEASCYADNPEWSVDKQLEKDVQLIDSIAEKQAQIFSEECKLFPADVQIQSIYPLPDIAELELKLSEYTKKMSNLQQMVQELASKYDYNPNEDYAETELKLREHLKSFLETVKSFSTIYTKEIHPWTHMMEVPQLHGFGPAANRLLEAYNTLLKLVSIEHHISTILYLLKCPALEFSWGNLRSLRDSYTAMAAGSLSASNEPSSVTKIISDCESALTFLNHSLSILSTSVAPIVLISAFYSSGRNQKTFRPKKSAPSGSKGAQLRKHIDATLGSGNLREAVRLPPGEDINEWLAVNTVDFFNQVNLLYGTLTEFCTPESCPTMTAGPKYEYRWADGVQIKKPIEVSAPKYVEYLMDWIEGQLDDESIFPQKLGTPFPPNFKEVVKTIFKRLFRVYAHIYHSHFQKIVSLKEEAHLNTCFKHFILFTNEFGLIDKKELAPLQELIESIIVPY